MNNGGGRKSHSTRALPEGYGRYCGIDLQKDKKTAATVNVTATVVMVALLALGHFCFVPVSVFFSIDEGMAPYFVRLGVLALSFIAYTVLHELTHAAAMRYFGAEKLRFGFTGLYAFAGSEVDYFDRNAYISVALAPLTVWGILFTVLLLLLPRSWFWVAYLLQLGNIAGAMGDVYVSLRTSGMPRDVLIRDTGVEMTVYSRETPPPSG